ncbi:penicillin-binding protein 2 [Clostridium sp. YIM B02505]|uniref:Penicillin-binding protein 2 n=1 Tax=Clostridium yunnanense TaxID=2800325 RepID=A0ABS1EWM8_9CLOT|nr:penicillin-binding transpeptidase domain-containing protein [Clostridium yunnanense]MBK1813784.1 penicillin-binding protein 2 [Clostridium yunnanense]
MLTKKRFIIIADFVIASFIVLIFRLFYVGNEYNPSAIEKEYSHNVQVDTTADNKYALIDDNNKDLLSYNKKYVVVIDAMVFKLNSTENNLRNLLALSYIMKNEVKDFSYKEILKTTGKIYYTVSEDSYNKIKGIKTMKGLYFYVTSNVNRTEAWKIENILSDVNKTDGKKLKDDGTLEHLIYDYTKNNKTPSVYNQLNSDGTYSIKDYSAPTSNVNVMLTLDKEWQDSIRTVLNNDKYKDVPNIGIALIEAKTGKVKALAQKDESQPNITIGIQNQSFEPGSTFKIITEEAAYNYGDLSKDNTFLCDGRYCFKEGKNYAHGTLSAHDAFLESCNTVFRKIGFKVGFIPLVDMAKKQGLFSKVLNLQYEGKGVEPKEENGIGNVSMGQTFNVTPLQMAAVVATAANNGVYNKPYIIDKFVQNDGTVVKKFTADSQKVIKPEVAKTVLDDMRGVVTESKGTGYNARIDGIETGGKTGTAEGENAKNHGWFAGYFKLNGEYYSLVVMVPYINQNSSIGKNGNATAAPVFKDIVLSIAQKDKQKSN